MRTDPRARPPVSANNGSDGRLPTELPRPTMRGELGSGTHTMSLPGGRHAELLVPGKDLQEQTPLLVMLHGAGGRADHMILMLFAAAEQYGVLVLAPQSQDSTWDVIRGRYGPDVRCIAEALNWTETRLAVDPARVAIGGFSDGASYALSLGLTNGDLFGNILAFSPALLRPRA